MKKKLEKIVIYLVIPLGLTLFLILSYFSGVDRLQQFVAPHINREYGLLENLQALFLLGIVLIAGRGFFLKKTRAEKIIMAIVFLASLFMFLEEMDYGLHYHRLLIGKPVDERVTSAFFNVHNIGESTSRFKNTGDGIMIVLFIVFPLLFSKSHNPLLRYLTPDRFIIVTMIGMLILSIFAHSLKDAGAGDFGSLHNTISEFRELIIYFIFMVYFFELAFEKNLAPQPN